MKLGLAILMLLVSGLSAQTNNPVTVTMISPAPGSTVRGVITVSATASSLAGPISKVEFYCDGKLFTVINNTGTRPSAPQAVSIRSVP